MWLWLGLGLWSSWCRVVGSVEESKSPLLGCITGGIKRERVMSVEALVVGVENCVSEAEQCEWYDLCGVLRGWLEDESRVRVRFDDSDERE